MKVREAIFNLLQARGVRYIFGNPGSTELPLIAGLPNEFRYVLCLHESVAVGAADGYALVSGETTLVNVHTTAGLGNAMGSISTARANKAPVVITAGQQDTRHLRWHPLLSGPLAEIARPLVKWSQQPVRAEDVPMALEQAFRIAATPPTGPVFLSLPMDFLEGETEDVRPLNPTHPGSPTEASLRRIASDLRSARRPAMVTGTALEIAGGWEQGVKLAEALALEVYAAPHAAQMGFPTVHPNFRGFLPNSSPALRETLERHDVVLVVGAPVFVLYPYTEGSYLPKDTQIILLTDDPREASRLENGEVYLGGLREALTGLLSVAESTTRILRMSPVDPHPPLMDKTGPTIAASDALRAISTHYTPETVLVDESISSGPLVRCILRTHMPRSYIRAASGGLGYGMPAAVGAQLARPESPVMAIVGDGSAMYAPQALWTASREGLPVKIIILNNSGYGILKSFNRKFFAHLGESPGLDLKGLELTALATSMDVPAASVNDLNQLPDALETTFTTDTPYLLDIRLDPGVRQVF